MQLDRNWEVEGARIVSSALNWLFSYETTKKARAWAESGRARYSVHDVVTVRTVRAFC
jgi:hypothetical protein